MNEENLQATGIVAEYNPFHNGHLYQVQTIKNKLQQPVIAVMSGSFVQRGEPAFLDKWTRAEAAVKCGVDLVLELPTCFALRSAQHFASGAVQLLAATGCVNTLCCGVESPAVDFKAQAQAMLTDEYQLKLREQIKDGASYAQAHSALAGAFDFTKPNDILALEYTKALLNTNIEPHYLARQSANYNDTTIDGSLASATAIRQSYKEHGEDWRHAVPPSTQELLNKHNSGYNEELLWQLIKYKLILLTPAEIAAACECPQGEGLENLIKQAAPCTSLSEALALCTNKRYSTSRIRRLLLQLLLGAIRADWQQSQPQYLRVLAFNATGRRLLRQMKKSTPLPLLTKLERGSTNGDSGFSKQLALDIKATNLLTQLSLDEKKQTLMQDYLRSPVVR